MAPKAKAAKKDLPTDRRSGGKAKPTPDGLIPEVVIISSKSSTRSSAPSSPATDIDSGSEVSGTRKRKRRAAAQVVVISSDDDEEEVPVKSSKASVVRSTKRRRITKRVSSPSSDYQGSSSEDPEDEDEDDDVEMASEISDEEEKAPKNKKAKGKAKAVSKPKAKGKAKSSKKSEESEGTGDDNDMDVDDEDEPAVKSSKKPTKRKTADDSEKPAKKAKRADSDPWKLGSRSVQSEWTYMQAPPFEMFHFARVVVDEYTYLDGKIHALITNLTADRQWVLSGTPPIHDFGALKTIAAFLNIHLGVHDDGEGRSAEVKKRVRDQTSKPLVSSLYSNSLMTLVPGAEKFHSFREVHTLEWHKHRHEIGQAFLNKFVRQVIRFYWLRRKSFD